VLLQQNSVAHYRVRLFECLTELSGVEFEFVADAESDTPYMPVLQSSSGAVQLTRCRLFRWALPFGVHLYFQPGALRRLLLGEFDVCIALGSPYSLTTWCMLLVGRIVGTPILLWTHGLLAPERGPKWWVRSLLYRCSSGLLLYGERARDLLRAQGLVRTPLFVIKNSLDPDAQARAEAHVSAADVGALRARLGLREQDRVLIFIGRLQPVKRLDLIVRAVAALGARGQRVHALLLGEGQQRESLWQLAHELGVNELVHFEGAQYDETKIAGYFAVSDLCVIPSGAGLTVMHALGYGTPVLTHDRPDLQFPEVEAIIPGETGAFYPHDDFAGLVAAISNHLFPEPLKAHAAPLCRQRVTAEFHPVVQARRIEEAVRAVSGRGSTLP